LENCHWYGETCFAGAAISTDGYLPQIPTRDKQVITDLMSALWREFGLNVISNRLDRIILKNMTFAKCQDISEVHVTEVK
jgi:hypothetical protein